MSVRPAEPTAPNSTPAGTRLSGSLVPRGQCRRGAACRPWFTLLPLVAAPRRCLSAMSLIFLGLGFFFEPEDRGSRSGLRPRSASQRSWLANPSRRASLFSYLRRRRVAHQVSDLRVYAPALTTVAAFGTLAAIHRGPPPIHVGRKWSHATPAHWGSGSTRSYERAPFLGASRSSPSYRAAVSTLSDSGSRGA
jgi:hypothetical protein